MLFLQIFVMFPKKRVEFVSTGRISNEQAYPVYFSSDNLKSRKKGYDYFVFANRVRIGVCYGVLPIFFVCWQIFRIV